MGADSRGKRHAQRPSQGRRERNCAAQKAYRQRQTLYVRELEEKLQNVSKPEDERFRRLEERNRYYRHELLEAYKKLQSTRISLDAVLRSVAAAIGAQITSHNEHAILDAPISRNRPTETQTYEDATKGLENLHHDEAEPDLSSVEAPWTASGHQSIAIFDTAFSSDDVSLETADLETYDGGSSTSPMEAIDISQSQDLPDNAEVSCLENEILTPAFQAPRHESNRELSRQAWSLPRQFPSGRSQIGYKAFKHLTDLSPTLLYVNDHCVRSTNSPFSDHINIVEQLISQEWDKVAAGGGKRYPPSLQNYISFMLSTFTSLSWESMRPFWVYTKSHRPIIDVTTWRLKPDADSYTKLAPWYRPTQVQLSVLHPDVIDWVPFPSLRDNLILLHSCNPRLDEIICNVADSYVMEADFSTLVLGAAPSVVYLRTLDLLAAISGRGEPEMAGESENDTALSAGNRRFDLSTANATMTTNDALWNASFSDDDYAQSESLPAASVADIFGSRRIALQTFRLLGMDRGPGALKLDPAFFERYPELYDSRCQNIIARGIAIKPPPQSGKLNSAPVLTPVDGKTLTKYTEMAKWYLDVSVADDERLSQQPIQLKAH